MKIKSLFTPKNIDAYLSEFNGLIEKPYYYFQGTNNILISSIHGFDHKRRDKIKSKDSGSVLFAFLLSKITNSNFIAVFQNNLEDSNYYSNTQVKEFLLNHKQPHKLLIDIHFSHAYRVADVEIGTMFDKTVHHQKVDLAKEFFKLYNFLVVQDETFAGMGDDETAQTMINFAKNCLNIEAMQFEINSSLINPDSNLAFWHRYYQLLNCFGQIIKEIEHE